MLLRRFQRLLLQEGVPLYWFVDVPTSHPAFASLQELAMAGVVDGAGSLSFEPTARLSDSELLTWTERARRAGIAVPEGTRPVTRLEFAACFAQHIA